MNTTEILDLVRRIDALIYKSGRGQSVIERAKERPWNHSDAEIRELWAQLIAPSNVEALKDILAGNLNVRARTFYAEALRQAMMA